MKDIGQLVTFLTKLTPFQVTRFAVDSDGFENWEDDRKEVASLLEGNVVSSKRTDDPLLKRHAVILDLDVPAYLVPSSRPGHSHLYIDVLVDEGRYFALLDALAQAGVIEHGYASASKKKGGTFLRLPWVKKQGVVA